MQSKRLLSKLEKVYKAGRLARIAVDEAHCASQWGHDWRPDYKKLGALKQHFPDTPMLALTATGASRTRPPAAPLPPPPRCVRCVPWRLTCRLAPAWTAATAQVVADVCSILRIEGCELFRASINRSNLFYEARGWASLLLLLLLLLLLRLLRLLLLLLLLRLLLLLEGGGGGAPYCRPPQPPTAAAHRPASPLPRQVLPKPASADALLDDIAGWVAGHYPDVRRDSGIVYALTRKDCEGVAAALAARGLSAAYYHADMDPLERLAVHERWSVGGVQCVVATIAFGMGERECHTRACMHACVLLQRWFCNARIHAWSHPRTCRGEQHACAVGCAPHPQQERRKLLSRVGASRAGRPARALSPVLPTRRLHAAGGWWVGVRMCWCWPSGLRLTKGLQQRATQPPTPPHPALRRLG